MPQLRAVLLPALLVLFLSATSVLAQHADVIIDVVDERLTTNERLFLSDFRGGLDNDGDVLELRNPGYITGDANLLESNAPLNFRILGPLLFSDGDGWRPAESTAYFELFRPLVENHSVTVTGRSGSQDGFVLAQADGQGIVHEHIRFRLRSEAEGPPETGVYAVQQVLTSPDLLDSDSFLLLFNHGLATPDFIQSVVAARQLVADSDFDCSGDGLLMPDDLACVANIEQRDRVLGAIGSVAGDLNGDRKVDFSDFLALSRNFGDLGTGYASGDIDLADGIGFPDFLALSRNFGFDGQMQASTVPEPNTASTLMLGFTTWLALMRMFRKRPSHSASSCVA